jgi:RimJ/RimL family protein N-acetyltransferase
MRSNPQVRLEPWGEGDFPLLERLLGDPQMTEHLGGPESPQKLAERQARYVRLAESETDRMFKIVEEATGEAVGSVGYWKRTTEGGPVYEIGWSVLTAHQGRGIAAAGTALAVAAARSERKFRYVHAYPSMENPASNAICRKLGFTLMGNARFEYPPGNFIQCNDWRLDLLDRRAAGGS